MKVFFAGPGFIDFHTFLMLQNKKHTTTSIPRLWAHRCGLALATLCRPVGAHLMLTALTLMSALYLSAEGRKNTFSIYFKTEKTDIDTTAFSNGKTLRSLCNLTSLLKTDSTLVIDKVLYSGYASPEGPADLNRRLSQQRRYILEAYVSRLIAVPDSLVERDISVYSSHAADAFAAATTPEERNRLIGTFDQERVARVSFDYHRQSAQAFRAEETAVPEMEDTDSVVPSTDMKCRRPLYIGLKTNMLYDALLIPTLGAEFYVGRGFSVTGQWSYAWWSRDARHRYWRYYGGDAGVRRWFGKAAKNKPLTGHHLGVYGQIFTYDFETGGNGQMGAKFNYGGGIEYGFALPIAQRLNIDFSIGIGFIAGKYYRYKPIDGHYVWQSTHHRRWFGPTKAEISLVWLIGCGNRNKKGGKP